MSMRGSVKDGVLRAVTGPTSGLLYTAIGRMTGGDRNGDRSTDATPQRRSRAPRASMPMRRLSRRRT